MIEPITFPETKEVFKAWGGELHIVNTDLYCLKKLIFLKGEKMSRHMHAEKSEVWYVESGRLMMTYFDLSNADILTKELKAGDVVNIPRGNPHQLEALENSTVTEASTKDCPEDNYRIGKGSSQLL